MRRDKNIFMPENINAITITIILEGALQQKRQQINMK